MAQNGGGDITSSVEAEAFRKIHPAEFYRKYLSQNVRPDGRKLNRARKTTISTGTINTADGSAMVRVGNTAVVAGVKKELAVPTDAAPKSGRIIPSVELGPICSNRFKPGRPSQQALALNEFLNRVLLSSGMLANDALCAHEGKAVWNLYVDLYCLNYDGNITDACLLAFVAAIRDVKLPVVTISDAGVVSVDEADKKMLEVNCVPVPTSFGVLDDAIVTDPTSEEEGLLSATFTVVCNSDGKLYAVHKPGGTALGEPEMDACIQRATKRASEVMNLTAGSPIKKKRNS